MGQPLPLSYNWRVPVVVATVGLIGCLGLLARGRPVGWVAAAALVLLCWVGYCLVAWLRTRSYLRVEGSAIIVRRWRALQRIEGSQVREVRELLTPAGPSYRMRVERAGTQTWVTVPTALLLHGQSTLFTWILRQAPDAAFDTRSRRTLELLQTRGLVE